LNPGSKRDAAVHRHKRRRDFLSEAFGSVSAFAKISKFLSPT